MSVLKPAPARIASCAPPVVCALLMCAGLLLCSWLPCAHAQSVDRTVGQTPTPTPTPAPVPKELPQPKVAIRPPASDSAPRAHRLPQGIAGPAATPAQATSRDVGRNAANLAADDPFTTEGRALVQQEQYDKAVVLYEQALEQHRAQHDRAGEARALNDLAYAYYALSRYEKVIADSEQARAIMHELGDRAGEVAPLNMLGAAYHELGSYDQAIAYYKEALAIVRELKDSASEAGALNNIGESLRLAGRCDEALKYINDALGLSIKRTVGGLGSLGIIGAVKRGLSSTTGAQADGVTLDSLGATYYCLGRDAEATDAFTRALTSYQQQNSLAEALSEGHPHSDLFDEGITRNNLGRVLLRQGQTDKALVELSRALVVNREVKNLKAEAATLGNLMRVWQARGNPRLAAFYGKQAVNALQAIRTNIQQLDKSVQKGFLSAQQDTYRVLADLLISTGRLAEAQQIVGMLKEEEFFAFVRRDAGEVSTLSARAALSPAEVELDHRYREIADRVAALGRERGGLRDKPQLTAEEEQRLSQLEADLEVAGQAFQKFLDGLAVELGNTPQTSDRVFQLRESQALMDTLRELGHGAVALYTVVGADKYRVILITPDVQKAAEYPIKEAELNRKVAAFREALQDPRRDPRPLAQELYKIIVGPIAQDLAEAHAETLMWSLDGTLRYVPIAALHDGDKYLVERFRNVVFTPASTSRLKDQPSAGWTALGLGVSKPHGDFPALPAVPAELRGIINNEPAQTDGVLPGRVMLDEAFTADALKTALRQRFPLVHIASHFQFAPGNETNSYLLLGDGTHLSLAQLKSATNLFSGVELLTLSACDTAAGGVGADGREVESFGVLAQRQGAKAVLASLWPVADASTQQLMQNFYRLRNAQAGLPKAEALRQAQLALLHSTTISAPASTQRGLGHEPGTTSIDGASYAHPYFWAPFILIGNWK